jgi:hypothetical protein
MFSHFRIVPFVLGFAVGLFVFFFYKPNTEIIRQYPHPSETKEKVFRDPNGMCYKYTTHEVDCDANEGTLKDYPIQG